MRKAGMHYGDVDRCPRLKILLGMLMSRGLDGATTLELQQVSGSMATSTDISAIRHQGYQIESKLESVNKETRAKTYRYTLIQPAHVEGLLF